MRHFILTLLILLTKFDSITAQPLHNHRDDSYIVSERNHSLFPLSQNDTIGKWIQMHPNVPRVDYWGVYFIDADTGFAVGDGGALIKTNNGGQTWRHIESGVTTLLRTIGSYDGEVIVAAGNGGIMIMSTDCGETWKNLPNVVTHNLWRMDFLTKQVGWLVGVGASALKTTDGGFTWTNQQTPLTGFPYWDISFYDTSSGYICTSNGIVLRTTNGGANWDIQQTGIAHALYTIKAITRQKAVAMGASIHVYTTDGGNNWNTINLFVSGIEKVEFLDSLTGFAITPWGSFKSVDGGVNWFFLANSMNGGYDIKFVDGKIGYLVSYLMVDKTTDSGQNWSRTLIRDNFMDVFFTNNNIGWLIGNYIRVIDSMNLLYKTIDGGRTLTLQSDFPGFDPSSVYFLDSLTGIVGAENAIFKTTDGGVTWIEKPVNNLPGNGGVYDRIFFVDENIGWAKSTYIIKTTDAGASWNFQVEDGLITGIHFSDPLNGWLTRRGNGVKPLKTTNGGNTWLEQTNIPLEDTYDVFFKDNLTGFIASRKFIPPNSWGLLYETYNGGLNWSVPDSSVTNLSSTSRFSNLLGKNIYLSGFGPAYKSSNTGKTWSEVIELQGKNIYHVKQSQYKGKFDVAAGSLGLIMRFNDSLIVSVGEEQLEHPKGFHLYQNYPNPFNPVTTISFDVPQPANVTLNVYDALGRKVATLVNERLNAGRYEYEFNAEGLSSGVYFYRLSGENFSIAKKFMLLK